MKVEKVRYSDLTPGDLFVESRQWENYLQINLDEIKLRCSIPVKDGDYEDVYRITLKEDES